MDQYFYLDWDYLSFSISFSCTGFRENKFIIFFFQYLLNGYFILGFSMQDWNQYWQNIYIYIYILKVSAVDFWFVIVIPFNVNEFGEVLAFNFIPSFFNVCRILLKIVLIILFFGFFYLRDYRITSYLKLLCLIAFKLFHFHYCRVWIVRQVFSIKIEFTYESIVLF